MCLGKPGDDQYSQYYVHFIYFSTQLSQKIILVYKCPPIPLCNEAALPFRIPGKLGDIPFGSSDDGAYDLFSHDN